MTHSENEQQGRMTETDIRIDSLCMWYIDIEEAFNRQEQELLPILTNAAALLSNPDKNTSYLNSRFPNLPNQTTIRTAKELASSNARMDAIVVEPIQELEKELNEMTALFSKGLEGDDEFMKKSAEEYFKALAEIRKEVETKVDLTDDSVAQNVADYLKEKMEKIFGYGVKNQPTTTNSQLVLH